jgi:hypothetical protein
VRQTLGYDWGQVKGKVENAPMSVFCGRYAEPQTKREQEESQPDQTLQQISLDEAW